MLLSVLQRSLVFEQHVRFKIALRTVKDKSLWCNTKRCCEDRARVSECKRNVKDDRSKLETPTDLRNLLNWSPSVYVIGYIVNDSRRQNYARDKKDDGRRQAPVDISFARIPVTFDIYVNRCNSRSDLIPVYSRPDCINITTAVFDGHFV